MRQNTEWGYIDWIYLPEAGNPKRWFSVGIVTVLPGKRQPPHVHYSNEQVLYVLSGEAESVINGKSHRVKKGDYTAIEADATHEAVNTGSVPFCELMITNPMPGGEDHSRGITRAIRRNEINPQLDAANRRKLKLAVESLKDSILKNNSLPYCLLDDLGDVVVKNDMFPPGCLENCDPVGAPKTCACFSCSITECRQEGGDVLSFRCPHGMTCYVVPILKKDRIIGLLRGGNHFSTGGDQQAEGTGGRRYDTPYATELSIKKTLTRIAGSVKRYIQMLDSTEELEKQKEELNVSLAKNLELEQNLSSVEDKITNLKINHHFLFNTLNCMAGMALDGDRLALYQSIIDLSKMFRYTMATDTQIVMLSREIEYLKAYLDLQKLRYQDGLLTEYEVDETCLSAPVPFNFLQPIVENAFTHSFMNYDYGKHVTITVERAGEQIRITCRNNGLPPKAEDLERIRVSWESGSGHGLSLIYDKLHACYGDHFSMDLAIDEAGSTCVTVLIPPEIEKK